MPQEPEVLLFDFWGVIGSAQSPEAIERMAALMDVPYDVFVDVYWAERHPYDAGEEAAAYWSRVAARVGAVMTPDRLAGLLALDTGSWRRVDDAMVALIAELASQGWRMALLSNAPREFVGLVEASAAAPYLDPLLFSCDLGLAKPDPAIYRRTLEILRVPAAAVLFIDDREVNVRAAEEVGLRGLVHTSVADTRAALAPSRH